jgi:hypothetical protein
MNTSATPGIDRERKDQGSRREHNAEPGEHGDGPSQNSGDQAAVETEEALETVVKQDVEALAETALGAWVICRHLYCA